MNLFYTTKIEGEYAYLSEEEARHVVQVLRKREGDMLNFTDGNGGMYEGQISEIGKKKCVLQIKKQKQEVGKRNFRLHIAIAPTKNINRYEWFLEKATEMGIEEITPIFCAHSERTKVRIDRLEKVLMSAMKQSLQAYLPKLNEPIKLAQFLKNQSTAQKFIAHCEKDFDKNQLVDKIEKGQDILLLIGPEGDFSVKEIEAAKEAGFVPVSLGNTRLRTETAGLFGVAVCAIQTP
jgi:16S rRNA (uracil1498-N3)-methyltransferase